MTRVEELNSPTLSERARELGAWLLEQTHHYEQRGQKWVSSFGAENPSLSVEASIWKSRAECVESLLAEREWQPIETAPKDGTYVLLLFAGPFSDAESRGIAVGRSYPERWWLTCIWAGSTSHKEPTHWLPLPLPPPSPQGETE